MMLPASISIPAQRREVSLFWLGLVEEDHEHHFLEVSSANSIHHPFVLDVSARITAGSREAAHQVLEDQLALMSSLRSAHSSLMPSDDLRGFRIELSDDQLASRSVGLAPSTSRITLRLAECGDGFGRAYRFLCKVAVWKDRAGEGTSAGRRAVIT